MEGWSENCGSSWFYELAISDEIRGDLVDTMERGLPMIDVREILEEAIKLVIRNKEMHRKHDWEYKVLIKALDMAHNPQDYEWPITGRLEEIE